MDVEFDDDDLDKLEVDPRATCGFPQGVVKGFRKVMQAIRNAEDERDLYALKGLRFEKLSGDRQGQRSLRCNDQYRLIVRLIVEGKKEKVSVTKERKKKKVRVIEITDYH